MDVRPEFRIGRVFGRRAAELIYRARSVALPGVKGDPTRGPEWRTITITNAWTRRFGTVGIDDGSGWFRVRLVDPWPEPSARRTRTASILGSVRDDSTGCAVDLCQVVVDGTNLAAYTDTLGRFVLAGVPIGKVGIVVCLPGYMRQQLEVRVPDEELVVRLKREAGYGFIGPCR
jgi:hypothetical protein